MAASSVPIPAVVRTIAPVIVGAIVSFFAARGIQLDGVSTNALTAVLTGLVSAGYYAAVLALESRWPIAGVLLGSTVRPTYEGRHRKSATDPATATSDTPDSQS